MCVCVCACWPRPPGCVGRLSARGAEDEGGQDPPSPESERKAHPSPHVRPPTHTHSLSLISKTCDRKIDEDTRGVIRAFCTKLVQALNKYYAFGSCFVDDAT